MKVRCGQCQVPFDVQGEGRYPCPACGAVNQVGSVPQRQHAPAPAGGAPSTPAASEAAPPPSKAVCSECDFSFFVGMVDHAPCPNCRASVVVAAGTPNE